MRLEGGDDVLRGVGYDGPDDCSEFVQGAVGGWILIIIY